LDVKPLEESKKTKKVNQGNASASGSAGARNEVLQKNVTEAKKALATSKKAKSDTKTKIKR